MEITGTAQIVGYTSHLTNQSLVELLKGVTEIQAGLSYSHPVNLNIY